MKPEELEKIRCIHKAGSELGIAVKVFSTVLGVVLGVLIGYIFYIL